MNAISPSYGVGADQFTDEDMELARRVVTTGAETLDRYHQSVLDECGYNNQDARQWWVGKIDWSWLDLAQEQHCILGQLFGRYDRGIEILVEGKPTDDLVLVSLNCYWAAANGFFTDPNHVESIPYGALEIAWVEVRDSAVG